MDNVPCWRSDEWVDVMVDIIASRSCPLNATPVRPGSLWASKATGRRGTVLWASNGLVKLSFDESDLFAYKVHAISDLLNLYIEIA